MNNEISFAERLAAAREKLGPAAPPPVPSTPVVQAPSAPSVTFMAPTEDVGLANVIDQLDVIEAYNMYAGKGTVDARGRTEGIKVRCPNPAHPDEHPSAWINTEKGTWACGACGGGGDKFDIAAWHFGMPVPGYKDGRNFHELRERMAASLGYVVERSAGVTTITPAPVVEEVPLPPVLSLVEDGPEIEPEYEISLDWRPLCPPGTFLGTYMKQVTEDDVPEEYHFWNGLMALAVALGRSASLRDLRPVYGNLFVCILGRTGSGKSKAKYLLDQLLHEAMPYSATDPTSTGVLRVSASASAEALIWAFQKRVVDPSAPKGTVGTLYPVRGIIDYSELSSLIGRAQRSGNVLVPTMMQFYDMENEVQAVSRTHGVETALEPFACAITTSQPKSLSGLVTKGDAASGFLNRWFFATGKEKPRIPVGGTMPDIQPAVMPLREVQAWAATSGGTIDWSQEALEAFEAFYYKRIAPVMKADESELLSRLDLLCKKLVLLFTANMQHIEVMPESIKQLEHIFPYLLECYGIPSAQVGSTLQSEIHNAVLEAVAKFMLKRKVGPTLRDMQDNYLRRRKYPLDLLNKTIKNMIDLEEIVATSSLPPGGKGRPSTRYTVENPEATLAYVMSSMHGLEDEIKEA